MLERLQARVVADVRHDQDLGVRRVGPPRGAALHLAPVVVRDAAPGLEPHHAVGVEQENGRAADAEALFERVQGGVVDRLEPAGSGDRRRQRSERADTVDFACDHAIAPNLY